MENYFNVLNAVDVRDKTEKKNNLSYLSWAWAWGEDITEALDDIIRRKSC